MAASDFEVNKTSGVGPTSIMVHPLQANETEVDKTATLVVQVGQVSKTVSLTQKGKVVPTETWEPHFQITPSTTDVLFEGTKSGEVREFLIVSYYQKVVDGVPQEEYKTMEWYAGGFEEGSYDINSGISWIEITKEVGERKQPGKLTLKTTSKNDLYENDVLGLGMYKTKERKATIIITHATEPDYVTLNLTQSGGKLEKKYRVEPSEVEVVVTPTNLSSEFVLTPLNAYEVILVNDVEVNMQVTQFRIPTVHEKFVGKVSYPQGPTEEDNNLECWIDNCQPDPESEFIDELSCNIHVKVDRYWVDNTYLNPIKWPVQVWANYNSEGSVQDAELIILPLAKKS